MKCLLTGLEKKFPLQRVRNNPDRFSKSEIQCRKLNKKLKSKQMDPKNNFLNAQPSIATNNEADRADDLSTTDNELEAGNRTPAKTLDDGDVFVNHVNDAEEIETSDPGMDEEA
jgi:hypothetical protein